MEQNLISPEPPVVDSDDLDRLAAIAISDPALLADAIGRACPPSVRKDGWSAFARKLFLQVLAETGRVSTACECAAMPRQAAYALRARDPLFAAGWDAACEIARAPLADALYEKALDGVTDTISKDGEVVATRHRFDSRLSIAVLHRLDKRCDRAEERGSRHLALVRHWDDWLAPVGKDDCGAALALLDPPPEPEAEAAQHCPKCQLRTGNCPTGEGEDDDAIDPADHCWKDDEDVWMTALPPPAGFTGYESDDYGAPGYERECTAEEAELLEAHDADSGAEERAQEEDLRDQLFALLRDRRELFASS